MASISSSSVMPSEDIAETYTVCNEGLRRTHSSRRIMKSDRRKCFMLILGVIQILLGSAFLCVGSWAVLAVRPALYQTGLAPFFLALLSYVGGGLAVFGPRSSKKNMILIVICVSTFACLLSLCLASWLFVSLMRSTAPSITSYKSFLMVLNVFLMLDTGIIAASTWTVRETVVRRRRQRRTNPLTDPPPAYYPNRTTMYFTGEAVGRPTTDAPPPYEP